MANELATGGVSLKYAVEATAGTRPTTGYTAISNIKSIGEFNPEPGTYEVTDLSDTVWKRYIRGLRDPGGAISFTANFTSAFKTAWAALVTAAEEAYSSGKATWFEVCVPDFGSFYFAGMPTELGLPAVETDSVFEGDVYVTPNQIAGWSTSST